MCKKYWLLFVILALLLLSGCYEGRGYAYEHLNSQDPGNLQRKDPGREEVSADDVEIGGTYEYLNKNLCGSHPECCGDFSAEEKWYHDLQARAQAEQNPELCISLPEEPFVVDCPGEEKYNFYDKKTCLEEAQ